jgi:hypothetical protein
VSASEDESYAVAVQRRLDLLNEIDRFEDSQRKSRSRPTNSKPTQYHRGCFDNPKADRLRPLQLPRRAGERGLQLNLPFDRLRERNSYRASLINFERQIRTLGQALDDVREDVRRGMRNLTQARQSYQIQKNAVELANRRVESATLYLQAGRVQIRDLLEAQNSQVQARNGLTQTLVDYHLVRLRLLIDIGVLDTGEDRFWLKAHAVGKTPAAPHACGGAAAHRRGDSAG